MYISNINIKNYRSFEDISIDFKDGINIIVGQNNSGKSNLLKALSIVFSNKIKKQLSMDDFYNGISAEELKNRSPQVQITIKLSQSIDENLMGDELVTVSNWLVKLDKPYLAQIQYNFFLPEEYEEKYLDSVKNIEEKEIIWEIIRSQFIRLYVYKIWVGDPINQVQADNDSVSKFDFQFLEAIRDVERDMFSGKNVLLKDIIDFFVDYDLKSNDELSEETCIQQIGERKEEFKKNSDKVIDQLKNRLREGTKEILFYADQIGASFDETKPTFEGSLTETEIYSILHLIVKQKSGMSIPIGNNGLGYNNLIFMSLLLSKMQVDSNGKYLGSNAKVFPILAIEEPEAHLHPTMQFQFMKFLKDNYKKKKVKQVFITTHSTHITSSENLDNIICLYKTKNCIGVAYPGKVFYELNENKEKVEKDISRKYVQRFLDATKSNIFFSEKIIFVEGMAEQLLMPVFAKYLGISLEEKHVSVINVGGRYFKHFMYLFDSEKEYTINRKVACITDLDPVRKNKTEEKATWNKCYPYEANMNLDEYEYNYNQSMKSYEEDMHPNIRIFTQNQNYGKTLEYQIAFENPTCKLLLTPSLSNKDELEELIDAICENQSLDMVLPILHDSKENKRIKESISQAKSDEIWTEERKKYAVFASRYLNSVEKGENALELSLKLEDNIEAEEKITFQVPEYIKKAIEWVCDIE